MQFNGTEGQVPRPNQEKKHDSLLLELQSLSHIIL